MMRKLIFSKFYLDFIIKRSFRNQLTEILVTYTIFCKIKLFYLWNKKFLCLYLVILFFLYIFYGFIQTLILFHPKHNF